MNNIILIGLIAMWPFSMFSGKGESKHVKLADATVLPYCKQLLKEDRLLLTGYGGAMMDKVNSYDFYFESNYELNLDDCRLLVVKVVTNFLEKVNSNIELRPYLKNYPFTADNIELMISFKDKNNKYLKQEYITLVFTQGGYIVYEKYDYDAKTHITAHKETFAEALEIVNKGKEQKLPNG